MPEELSNANRGRHLLPAWRQRRAAGIITLAYREPPGVGRDTLAIAVDDDACGGARKPARAGFDGRKHLLGDHRGCFALAIVAAMGEFLETQADDLARFDSQHRACIPGKPVVRAA